MAVIVLRMSAGFTAKRFLSSLIGLRLDFKFGFDMPDRLKTQIRVKRCFLY